MSDYHLRIFAGQVLVGTLAFEPSDDSFSLSYAAQWAGSAQGYALSPHLPLQGACSSLAIRRFIENLLPEGRALDVASVHANIQKNNIFGLIRQLGQETAGALQFLPEGQAPLAQASPMLREVLPHELQERIAVRSHVPFSVWDGRVRMSLAGFQDKLLALLDGGRIYLADGALASTHILKPEPQSPSLPHMVANEHYCMALANRISQRRYGQDCAAQVQILRVPAPVLAVQRFDRQRLASSVQRIHIIDGCQALNLPVSAKYERNFGNGHDVQHIRDGVGFESLMALRPQLVQPAVGIQKLILWAVTTLLLGNSDAHGKNISFYCRSAGLAVAPLYDLVSVAQYDANTYEHALAMGFGDAFENSGMGAYALADFCIRCAIPRAYFARELATLCQLALEEAPAQTQDGVYQGDEPAFVRQIASYVRQRALALLGLAAHIPKFHKDSF